MAALKKAKAEWIPANEEHGYPEGKDEYYRRVFPPDETALDGEFLQLSKLFAVRAFQAMTLPPETPKRSAANELRKTPARSPKRKK